MEDLDFFKFFARIQEFSRINVNDNAFLHKTFLILKEIFLVMAERSDSVSSLEVLDCLEHLSLEENYAKFHIKENLKQHLLDLIPLQIMIFPNELDKLLDGHTNYSKNIFISDKHLPFCTSQFRTMNL